MPGSWPGVVTNLLRKTLVLWMPSSAISNWWLEVQSSPGAVRQRCRPQSPQAIRTQSTEHHRRVMAYQPTTLNRCSESWYRRVRPLVMTISLLGDAGVHDELRSDLSDRLSGRVVEHCTQGLVVPY